MNKDGFALFDTAIGRCAIAWGARGIVGVNLPEGRESATRARMQQRFPDTKEALPPVAVKVAIDRIAALLGGERSDLSAIVLDMDAVPPFHRRVYQAARALPPGTTVSYGAIAAQAGSPGGSRAVGQALGRNPFAVVVPCHRVLAAGGKVGGFSAAGGITTKLRMLAIESAHAARGKSTGVAGGPIVLAEPPPPFAFDTVAAVTHLRAADPSLGRLIDRVGPFAMQRDHTASIFAALAQAIVYQQLSGKAAATIYARVRALFPRVHEGPTPQQILRASDEKLRGAGLSRSKLLSLRDLAHRTKDGALPTLDDVHQMDDEAIIESLTGVRGIGRWTAEMLLMFRLGRPDVLPADDYGVRKGYAVAFKKRALPTREQLQKHGARWKPYRSVASWYLWRALDVGKG
ncbi:MAG TPA: methylated-DNA--[protein]-cysteine S-methyltransferase [Polyangia bacterium]|nr:methylated-DNA--[protein]-cysteine S-methyltransferase [Polyangia bacterium]